MCTSFLLFLKLEVNFLAKKFVTISAFSFLSELILFHVSHIFSKININHLFVQLFPDKRLQIGGLDVANGDNDRLGLRNTRMNIQTCFQNSFGKV